MSKKVHLLYGTDRHDTPTFVFYAENDPRFDDKWAAGWIADMGGHFSRATLDGINYDDLTVLETDS